VLEMFIYVRGLTYIIGDDSVSGNHGHGTGGNTS
jgi:hypothetical protein